MTVTQATAFRVSILAQLARPNTAIHIAEVPEDKNIEYANGMMKPFYVVYWGGPIRAATGRHLVGNTRHDTTIMFLTVEAYAATSHVAGMLKDAAIDKLTGFIPADSSYLKLEGGMTETRSATTVRPAMYVETTQFTCMSNMSWR